MDFLYTPRCRTEHLIASMRALLAAASLLAIWLDPSEPSHYAYIAYVLLSVYLGYAVLLVPLAWISTVRLEWLGLATHLIDLLVFTLFMYFTEGPTSPFFVYFVFSLFCAALRWHRSGTFWTALAVLGLFIGLGVLMGIVLHDPGVELNRFIIRSVYLGIVALLLGYMSSYEKRSREELANFAAWPQGTAPSDQPQAVIRETLQHAAKVLRSPRALMVWEEPEEPYRYLAYLTDHRFEYNRESPTAFDPVVAEPLEQTNFVCPNAGGRRPKVLYKTAEGFRHWDGPLPLNSELIARFAIDRVLSLRFNAETFQGWLLFLDKPAMTSDDLMLGGIVAHRITAILNQMEVQHRLNQAAVAQERNGFARDLHDGMLQSLTGIALQLETVSRSLSEDSPARKGVKEIQAIIVEEQRRLRSLIEQLKSVSPLPPTRSTPDTWLDKLAGRIECQ